MFRLLGMLVLGNLLIGGRGRRALRRGLFFGGLLGYLASRHPDRTAADVRRTAEQVRKSARRAVKDAKKAFRKARKAEHDLRAEARLKEIHGRVRARKEERDLRMEDRLNAIHAEIEARKARLAQQREPDRERKAEPAAEQRTGKPAETALPEAVYARDEARDIRDLVQGLERDARTAAMAASVPTIDFPEEDEKYHASRKYGYV